MVRENGMVMMKEQEYYKEVTLKEYEIEDLKTRCEQLAEVISKLIVCNNDESTIINPRDFVIIWNNVFDRMNEGNKEEDLIYTEATLHWNGLVANLGDGAAFANYVIPMLTELADELEA